MSTLPTPGLFRNLDGKVDPSVISAIRLIFNGVKDAHDATIALAGQHGTTVQNVTNNSTTIASLVQQFTTISESVPEGNVNQQTVPYAIQNSDYGGVVILQGAGPYDVTLNSAVSLPYYTFCFNFGAVSATVTPDLGGSTINNVASLTLQPNQWMMIFFDGLNWWALTFTLPVSIAKVASQWLDSYNAATGVFTQSQPAASDLSNGTTGSGAVVLETAPTLVSPVTVSGLQIFANNAAAIGGGLAVGELYRTGADPDLVAVVH